jgi:chromosome segregation ATPase
MYTDLIVKQCMAQNPEERGSFLELQAIIEGFRRQMDERPHHVLLVEQQETIFELRMGKNEDSKSLFEAEEEIEEIKKAKADLELNLDKTKEECEKYKEDLKSFLEQWNEMIAEKERDKKQKVRYTQKCITPLF